MAAPRCLRFGLGYRLPPGSLLVGDRIVKVLSMKEPPNQTFAFLLQDLYEIPFVFVACLEWQRI